MKKPAEPAAGIITAVGVLRKFHGSTRPHPRLHAVPVPVPGSSGRFPPLFLSLDRQICDGVFTLFVNDASWSYNIFLMSVAMCIDILANQGSRNALVSYEPFNLISVTFLLTEVIS